MRENVINCDKVDFISIIEVKAHKTVNEHATFYIKGHVAEGSDVFVLRNSAGQGVKFTALDQAEGRKEIFNGLISDIPYTQKMICPYSP